MIEEFEPLQSEIEWILDHKLTYSKISVFGNEKARIIALFSDLKRNCTILIHSQILGIDTITNFAEIKIVVDDIPYQESIKYLCGALGGFFHKDDFVTEISGIPEIRR